MTAAQTIARLLATKELEVEDILAVARTAGPDDAASLRLLERNLRDSQPGEVPYTAWLGAVCTYLEAGYGGLLELAQEEDSVPFVLGVLEELATPEAVSVLAEIAVKAGEKVTEEVASTVNALSSLSSVAAPDPARQKLLSFLHSILTRCQPDEAAYALALYALRGVGDNSSLTLLTQAPDASGPYRGALRDARAAIRKRLRETARQAGKSPT